MNGSRPKMRKYLSYLAINGVSKEKLFMTVDNSCITGPRQGERIFLIRIHSMQG